jgi:uncharacterized membrane protein
VKPAHLLHGRHAADYECIELGRGRLTVEIADADSTTRYELCAHDTRVAMAYGARLELKDRERVIEVGRHLDERSREGFAVELAKRLKS